MDTTNLDEQIRQFQEKSSDVPDAYPGYWKSFKTYCLQQRNHRIPDHLDELEPWILDDIQYYLAAKSKDISSDNSVKVIDGALKWYFKELGHEPMVVHADEEENLTCRGNPMYHQNVVNLVNGMIAEKK